jgi:hypothetical protein
MKTKSIYQSFTIKIRLAFLFVFFSGICMSVFAQGLISTDRSIQNNPANLNAVKVNPNGSTLTGTRVEISELNVMCNPDNTHTISWTSTFEPEGVSYMLYKNYDINNWQYAVYFPIVHGIANGSNDHLYSITDNVVNQPITFYKLVATFNSAFSGNEVSSEFGPLKGDDCSNDLPLSMLVYPNPASDVAYVSFEGLSAGKQCLVSVYDENGLPVQGMETIRDGNTFSLNMNDLKPGRYFIHAVLPETSETFSKSIIKL